MFGLIKWLIIILILGAFLYVANFFSTMDDDVLRQVKADAIDAIDSGDTEALTSSLGGRMREDLKTKLKNSLHHLID